MSEDIITSALECGFNKRTTDVGLPVFGTGLLNLIKFAKAQRKVERERIMHRIDEVVKETGTLSVNQLIEILKEGDTQV